jgi:hypothetical protein
MELHSPKELRTVNTPILKILPILGLAATLSACASFSDTRTAGLRDRLAQIHAGLTQDEVRSLAGAPAVVGSNPRSHETLWTYDYMDVWGYPSEFGVDFDNATGRVTETSSERLDY